MASARYCADSSGMRRLVFLLATLSVVAPATADAQARRCGHLPVDNGFPGVRQIRGENVICPKARKVARHVQRDWQQTGGPVTLTRANGQLWECRYREVIRREYRFVRARCWQERNPARRVGMKLVS